MIRSSIFAVGAAALISGSAFAASITLDVSDVDFNDRAQVEVVYDRIADAAESVCRSDRITTAFSPLYAPMPMSECISKTVAQTVEETGSPNLAAVHVSRTVTITDYAELESDGE